MTKSRAAIIVQARTSSSRLPGKVLLPLCGAPAIVRMVERVARSRKAARLLVATSSDASDDELAVVCERNGIDCVRGSLGDVLGRMAAAAPVDCDIVVRLTGDCPVIDPRVIDECLERFERVPDAQYVTNAVQRTYPDGLDVEVVSRERLMQADREATAAYDREHVTPWIQRHARMIAVTQTVDLSALRLVLDTADDYECLAAVYDHLYPAAPDFDTRAVLSFLQRRPDLVRVAGATVQEVLPRIDRWLAVEPFA